MPVKKRKLSSSSNFFIFGREVLISLISSLGRWWTTHWFFLFQIKKGTSKLTKMAILRKKGTLGNQWQSLINSPSILLPTMRCILLVVVCWVWAGLRWWRRRRRRRTIVVRCSVASVVIPSKQSELGQGTEFKLTQCAIVYSSTKKVCSHTQSWPIQLVSLRSCVYLHVGPTQLDAMNPVTQILVTQQLVMYPQSNPTEAISIRRLLSSTKR